MPALNFKKEFVDAIENGLALMEREPFPHPGRIVKRQTIRKLRKDGRDPRQGQYLQLYTGQRTKRCRLLGEVQCLSSRYISIGADAEIRINNYPLKSHEYDELVLADGFKDFESFLEFFKKVHGLPFEGVVIQW